MDPQPSVELVLDRDSGVLRHCYVLDSAGKRVMQLPIVEAREKFAVREPGIVSLDLHSFRVARTREES